MICFKTGLVETSFKITIRTGFETGVVKHCTKAVCKEISEKKIRSCFSEPFSTHSHFFKSILCVK